MLIQVHMLQNHSPSNLNRDDTGSPKDCLFGGVLRARISSQCLKHSIRRSSIFTEELKDLLGKRTRGLPKLIGDALTEMGCDEETIQAITLKASALGKKDSKEQGEPEDPGDEGEPARDLEVSDGGQLETRQLIFIDPNEVALLASELKTIFDSDRKRFGKLPIKDVESRLSKKLPRSVDIALFGRFTTTSAFEDVHSAVQVAHALSTTKVEKQFDYFSAVDDLNEGSGDHGAGMIGDVEFNSATYYKYFSIDWNKLLENLGGDVEVGYRTIAAFINAAALSTPTGKQNTFAAHNPPDFILIEVNEENVPISYANAFVKPVRADRDEDVVQASVRELGVYADMVKRAYSIAPAAEIYLSVRGQEIPRAGRVENLATLVSRTIGAVKSSAASGAVA